MSLNKINEDLGLHKLALVKKEQIEILHAAGYGNVFWPNVKEEGRLEAFTEGSGICNSEGPYADCSVCDLWDSDDCKKWTEFNAQGEGVEKKCKSEADCSVEIVGYVYYKTAFPFECALDSLPGNLTIDICTWSDSSVSCNFKNDDTTISVDSDKDSTDISTLTLAFEYNGYTGTTGNTYSATAKVSLLDIGSAVAAQTRIEVTIDNYDGQGNHLSGDCYLYEKELNQTPDKNKTSGNEINF
jgi:hypothetical protein